MDGEEPFQLTPMGEADDEEKDSSQVIALDEMSRRGIGRRRISADWGESGMLGEDFGAVGLTPGMAPVAAAADDVAVSGVVFGMLTLRRRAAPHVRHDDVRPGAQYVELGWHNDDQQLSDGSAVERVVAIRKNARGASQGIPCSHVGALSTPRPMTVPNREIVSFWLRICRVATANCVEFRSEARRTYVTCGRRSGYNSGRPAGAHSPGSPAPIRRPGRSNCGQLPPRIRFSHEQANLARLPGLEPAAQARGPLTRALGWCKPHSIAGCCCSRRL